MKTDYFFLFLEVISCNFFQFLSNIIPSYFFIVTKEDVYPNKAWKLHPLTDLIRGGCRFVLIHKALNKALYKAQKALKVKSL